MRGVPKAAGLLLAAPALVFVPWIEDGFELPKAIILHLGSLVLAGLFLLGHRHRPEDGPLVKTGGLDRPVAAFLAVACLFTAVSIHPHLSFFGQYRLYSGGLRSFLSCGLLYGVVSRLPVEAAQKAVFRSLLGAGLVVLAYAAAQRCGWDPFPWREAARLHPIATFGSPFKFAPFLALLLPAAVSAYWLSSRGAARLFWLVVVAVAIFELLATLGRGAWLGALIAMALWAALNWDDVKLRRGRLYWLLGVIILTLLGLWLFGPSSIQNRMSVFLNRHEGSAANRLELWRMGLRMVQDAKGWGRGLETFGLFSPAYETMTFREGVGVSEIATNAHNELLHICVTMGALGVAAYVWLWGDFFRLAWRRVAADVSGQRALLSGLFCGAVAHWIYVQFNFGITATSAYVWAIMGALGGLQVRVPAPVGAALPGDRARRPARARHLALLCVGVLLLAGAYRSVRDLAADRYFKQTQSLSRRRQWLKAVDVGKRAVSLNPWGPYSMTLALAYRSLSELSGVPASKAQWFNEASRVSRAHLRRYPQDPDAHHNYAMSLMWRVLEFKEPVIEQAIEEEKKAIALAPMFPDFWNALGQMFHFAGRIDEAKRAWVSAVDVAPGYEPARAWLEKYLPPQDIFEVSPSDLEVDDLPLGRQVFLERERNLVVKIANLGEDALKFRVDVVAAPWHPSPLGYGTSPAVRLRSQLTEFKVPPNEIMRLPLEVFVPAPTRFKDKRFCLFLRLRCLNFDIPVDRIVRVLIHTGGKT